MLVAVLLVSCFAACNKKGRLTEEEATMVSYITGLKESLKDPDSFQAAGTCYLIMTDQYTAAYFDYRAKNSFGGYISDETYMMDGDILRDSSNANASMVYSSLKGMIRNDIKDYKNGSLGAGEKVYEFSASRINELNEFAVLG